ncbi:hypothetical protein E3Q22_01333 [Wallemia mellicola]|uniref:Dilute domain-containing protein n=2 Tax=Wallemia mellicola TaxID=1708541 RepID=A0A4T0M6N0_9BASI|nr:hypothetical protein E3Q23_00812 [Wallemia mellicola]TIB81237.1 hypothetical protein E3Q22_01333 [Wallemia mellicola]TIC00980.1 hypothetical protein E3Q18_00858 [Wallemia mellicola]TIC32454.1 hypothetical protein E3Q10_01267 [Wallemia mellicola]TIC75924.1 hypothetical protein E3Q00_00261 [Wallemia mellicola]
MTVKPELKLSVDIEDTSKKLPSPHTATKLLSDPIALLPPILSVDDVEKLLSPENTLSKNDSNRLANRALNEAISSKNREMLECVLGPLGRRWVDVDLNDNEGSPMIVLAAASVWLDGVSLLIKTGADVNASDSQSWTALHWATINSQSQPDISSQIIGLLLQNGASPLVKSNKGRTAKDIAPASNDIVELLEVAQEQAFITQSNSDLFSLSQASATPSQSGRSKQRAKDKKAAYENSVLRNAAKELDFECSLILKEGELDEAAEEDGEELTDSLSKTFDWNTCLPHQMLIINSDQVKQSIDALLSLSPHPKPLSYESSPASALFLWQRYAFYVGDPSGELSSIIFDHAVENIEQTLFNNPENLPLLAFWLHNVTLWLYFINSDASMSEECKDMQDILSDFTNEIYVFIVRLVERKMDRVIEPFILDFNSMPEFDDIRFDGEWRIMRALTKRKGSVRSPNKKPPGHRRNGGGSLSSSIFGKTGGSTSSFSDIFSSSNADNNIETLKSPSMNSFDDEMRNRPLASDGGIAPSASLASLSNTNDGEDIISEKFSKVNIDDVNNNSPKKVTQLLNSTLIVLELYNVNEALIIQIFSQIFYWTACEIFNRMITNKKYYSRSRASMIRLNLSAIEDWVNINKLPSSIFTYHFATVSQMLRWLGCLSAMSDFSALISTLQTLRQLNPKQLFKLQKEYRHEAGPTIESRMSSECVEYLEQFVNAWDSRKKTSETREDSSEVPQKTQNHIDNIYPENQSSSSAYDTSIGLGLGLQPLPSNSNVLKDVYVPPPLPENFNEQVDSRYMLPFELPTNHEHLQWRRKHSFTYRHISAFDTPKISSPGLLSDDDHLSILNSRPPSRASSCHSTGVYGQFTVTPDVPEDILEFVDRFVHESLDTLKNERS